IATVGGTIIAVILGLLIAVLLRGLPAWAAWLPRLLVAFVRNTPLIVQLVFVYTLFSMSDALIEVSALTVGIAVIGVHYSTYMSGGSRTAIAVMLAGDWEAFSELSLRPSRLSSSLILP